MDVYQVYGVVLGSKDMSLDLTDFQNKKYTTRDGRPVRILCTDGPGLYPVVGVLLSKEMINEKPLTWTINGDYSIDSAFMDENKLINAKTKKEGWIQVRPYMNKGGTLPSIAGTTNVYEKKEEALDNGWGPNCPCIKIEWEE